MAETSFDKFAGQYDKMMGNTGDYTHQNTIDPAFFQAIGIVTGKTIYDIGCGNGYIARKLVKKGAKEVWASDISPAMIDLAKNKYPQNGIKYLIKEGSDFKNIPKKYFDLIVMNMVIHYISDLDKLFRNVARSLKPKGRFVFTSDHPFHSLSYLDIGKFSDFQEVLEDARKYTSGYTKEFPNFWDKNLHLRIFRRSQSQYINLLSKYGLYIDCLIEPPTKRTVSYEDKTPVYSPIPFKFALGAIKMG